MNGLHLPEYLLNWIMSFISILIHAQRLRIINVKDILISSKTDFLKNGGCRVFCNPPYSKIGDWVAKCFYEAQQDNTIVVMLIPARTDTRYFHNYILNRSEIRFLKGRLKFGDSKNSAPFPSMVVIFRGANITSN